MRNFKNPSQNNKFKLWLYYYLFRKFNLKKNKYQFKFNKPYKKIKTLFNKIKGKII